MKSFEKLGRLRQIAFALIRHGFGDVVQRMDLSSHLGGGDHPVDESVKRKPTWVRIRLLLEELGPTFIKIGQILSLRPDLIPVGLTVELGKLQNNVAPLKTEKIREVVAAGLGRPVDEAYSFFDPKPLASASLAQVHRGVIRSTRTPVAIKVLKPGIEDTIAADLDLLETAAETLNRNVENLEVYDLPGIVREIRSMLTNELDMEREAMNMAIARSNLSGFEHMRVPRVYDDFTSRRVLCMELFQGKTLSEMKSQDIQSGREMGVEGLQVTVKQVLDDGFFHADPHPGNLVIMEGGRFGLLDWGMTGRLTRQRRYQIVDLISAMVDKDEERIVDGMLRIAGVDRVDNRHALETEVLEILDIYYSAPLEDIQIGRLMMEMTALLREHRIRIQPDLASMIKALVTSEGTARLLYPRLNAVAEAEPFVRELAKRRYSWSNMTRELKNNMSGFVQLQKKLPGRISSIIDKVEHGRIRVRFRHENLENLISTLESVSNRLALTGIIAALFLGSSMIMDTDIEPLLFGYPALGVVGYMVSGVLGVWLAVLILRRKKF